MPQPNKNRILSYSGAMMKEGKEAEAIVKSFLGTRSLIKEVIDHSEDKDWQKIDVDFLIRLKDGSSYKAEVKADKWISRSKNFPFEVLRMNYEWENKPASLGWTLYSEADYFFLSCKPANEIYSFKKEDVHSGFQGFLKDYQDEKNFFAHYLKNVKTDNERRTWMLCVPISYMNYTVWRKIGDKWQLGGTFVTPVRKQEAA